MAQFLSPEWFDEVAQQEALGQPGEAVVVEVAVTGAPMGEVRYQVVLQAGRAIVVPPAAVLGPAQLLLSSDYATLAGIASGRLSAMDALSLGSARISGDTGALSSCGPASAGLDLVPAGVRARTTF